MKHLKIFENVNYYQYTLNEILYKLINNKNDENLIYLVKMYIIYKEQFKNTTPKEIELKNNEIHKIDNKLILPYNLKLTSISSWITVENYGEFVNFINEPEIYPEINKYNL